jgi:hypothetical protein
MIHSFHYYRQLNLIQEGERMLLLLIVTIVSSLLISLTVTAVQWHFQFINDAML